jgi:hypothetical protein
MEVNGSFTVSTVNFRASVDVVVGMKITALWNIAPYSLFEVD